MSQISNNFHVTITFGSQQNEQDWQITKLDAGSLHLTQNSPQLKLPVFIRTHQATQSLLNSFSLPQRIQLQQHKTINLVSQPKTSAEPTPKALKITDEKGHEILDVSSISDPEVLENISELVESYSQAVLFLHSAKQGQNQKSSETVAERRHVGGQASSTKEKQKAFSKQSKESTVPKTASKQKKADPLSKNSHQTHQTKEEERHSNRLQDNRLSKRQDQQRLQKNSEIEEE